jgi:hypothetical protein
MNFLVSYCQLSPPVDSIGLLHTVLPNKEHQPHVTDQNLRRGGARPVAVPLSTGLAQLAPPCLPSLASSMPNFGPGKTLGINSAFVSAETKSEPSLSQPD